MKCHTPLEINIEPEFDGLEDVSPFPGARILRFQPLIFRGVRVLNVAPTKTFPSVSPSETRQSLGGYSTRGKMVVGGGGQFLR